MVSSFNLVADLTADASPVLIVAGVVCVKCPRQPIKYLVFVDHTKSHEICPVTLALFVGVGSASALAILSRHRKCNFLLLT